MGDNFIGNGNFPISIPNVGIKTGSGIMWHQTDAENLRILELGKVPNMKLYMTVVNQYTFISLPTLHLIGSLVVVNRGSH